ncbi:hypothetical protein LIER_41944 [Lithospermum erythrorhizon]|uniref:Uncharacterized protein n=1 Tax=Lithospermum erythrorhizon TaxID=34254 RepID=A0AAV3RK78_LITER
MPIAVISTIFLSFKIVTRRIERKLKRRKFKQNGGLLLQKYLSSNENMMKEVRLFTSKDLDKATDHFNENRILGQGAQGTVYKGMLGDV